MVDEGASLIDFCKFAIPSVEFIKTVWALVALSLRSPSPDHIFDVSTLPFQRQCRPNLLAPFQP